MHFGACSCGGAKTMQSAPSALKDKKKHKKGNEDNAYKDRNVDIGRVWSDLSDT